MKWALVVLACVPAFGHRIDEYLQGTILTVEKDRVTAQITLSPGVAVYPFLAREFDADGNGVVSSDEQHAYAERVMRDLSLAIDGEPLKIRLVSLQFSSIGEMKEGLGEIRIELEASLPRGGPYRRFMFENRHLSRIAAYQVNTLVPQDPDLRIVSQNRNVNQSHYELDFTQVGTASSLWRPGFERPLETLALLVVACLALAWRRHQAGGLDPRRFTQTADRT